MTLQHRLSGRCERMLRTWFAVEHAEGCIARFLRLRDKGYTMWSREHFVHPNQSSIVELMIRNRSATWRCGSCQAIAEHDVGVTRQRIQISLLEIGWPFHNPLGRRAERDNWIGRRRY